MCSECLASPCNSRCPNASEPMPVYRCSECGEGIFGGDRYTDIEGYEVCKACTDNMSREEIIKMCGYEVKSALVMNEAWQ